LNIQYASSVPVEMLILLYDLLISGLCEQILCNHDALCILKVLHPRAAEWVKSN